MDDRQVPESDCFDRLEEEFMEEQSNVGYDTGFELGKKDGNEEGYSQGLIEGQKIGSEVGFYLGYTMTWMLLNPELSTKSTKILNTLNEVIELANNFPKTNETTCEEKLSNIRMKIKQTSALLNLKSP